VSFIENAPKKGPEGFVFRDFRKPPSKIGQAQAMVALPAIAACTQCKISGSLLVPMNMDFKLGDRIMDGKIVKGFCEGCRQNTEFRALTPEELTDNQFYILRRNYEIYKREQIDGRELPPEVAAFVKAYDDRLKAVMKLKGIGPAAPQPKIVLP